MANRRKPMIDLHHELDAIFDPWVVQDLINLKEDPDADLSAGQLAKAGAALALVADALTQAAKTQAAGSNLTEDQDVYFTHREGGTQTRVNTKYLRERFPAVNYPEMWQETQVSPSVAIDLPFRVK